jgi:hypothetical protein
MRALIGGVGVLQLLRRNQELLLVYALKDRIGFQSGL